MQMNRAVLMPFRHKDIPQPLPPHAIIRPAIENVRQRSHVVPVNLRRVERQRDEPPEIVAKRQIPDTASSPPHASFLIGGGRSFRRLSSGLIGGARASCRLSSMLFPSALPEAWDIRGQEFKAPIRVALHSRRMRNFMYVFWDNSRRDLIAHDVIMSLYQV